MASYLPTSRRVGRMTWRHPWRRSYHKRKKAEWETDNTYCSRIRRHPPYNTGRRLLDIMDMSVFDFFTGMSFKWPSWFFISEGNKCFYGVCSYYCDSGHPMCGNPDHIQGSIQAFLPSRTLTERIKLRHPWRRSYSKFRRAVWEDDNSYCDLVRVTPPFNKGRLLIDFMDMSVFDFLTGSPWYLWKTGGWGRPQGSGFLQYICFRRSAADLKPWEIHLISENNPDSERTCCWILLKSCFVICRCLLNIDPSLLLVLALAGFTTLGNLCRLS